jgi:hypothetical protein
MTDGEELYQFMTKSKSEYHDFVSRLTVTQRDALEQYQLNRNTSSYEKRRLKATVCYN